MRHNRQVKYLGRKSGARKALIRTLVDSLVAHGRIQTTVEKAKELRRHVERAVTMGKKGTLHARRILLSRYPNEETVRSIMSDLSPRFKERPGGYTRIVKLDKRRAGDSAEMALIEFVDYNYETAKKPEVVSKVVVAKRAEKKRKHLRKLQGKARQASRKQA